MPHHAPSLEGTAYARWTNRTHRCHPNSAEDSVELDVFGRQHVGDGRKVSRLIDQIAKVIGESLNVIGRSGKADEGQVGGG